MGFLSKLKKKSIGHKLVGNALKKDPIAGKLVKHDPLMKRAIGSSEGGKGKMTVKDALRQKMGAPASASASRPASRPAMSGNTPASSASGRRMSTGGNAPATPTAPRASATNRLNKLGGMNRPARRGRFEP